MPDESSREDRTKRVPAAMMLASEPEALTVTGKYDEHRETWSNRLYESAGTKKHNEAH